MDFPPTVLDFQAPALPAPGPEAVRGATLRELLTHLYFDRRRLAAVLLLGLVLTAIATYLAPTRYVAEAQLLVRLGREYIYTPEVGSGDRGSPVAYDREQTLQAEARILTSRDTLEHALDKVGVAAAYPKLAAGDAPPEAQRSQAVVSLERALDAELAKGSNLLQVKLKHADAATSARLLSAVIDAYLVHRSEVLNSASLEDVQADAQSRKLQLDAAEARLAEFKSQRGIRAFETEQRILLEQRNALEQRESQNKIALAQATGRVQALTGTVGRLQTDVTLSSETLRSEAADHARKLLLDLKLKERDLTSKFSDSHLMVQDVRADIARAEQFLRETEQNPARAVRSGRSPARDVAEADLLRARADERQAQAGEQTLSQQLTELDARIAELTASETTLRRLERERRLAEVNYEAAAKRLRDESTLAELDRKRRNSVGVVQAPAVPLEASSLKPLVAVLGVFLTCCAALLTAFFGALWRDTYLLPEQLQRDLDVPLLAAVPRSGR